MKRQSRVNIKVVQRRHPYQILHLKKSDSPAVVVMSILSCWLKSLLRAVSVVS